MNNPADQFDADYYLNGKASGKSNYVNYRHLPEVTDAFAKRIMQYLGGTQGETVLDFGCARGYLVKALRDIGYYAFGYDISKWATENCHPETANIVTSDIGKLGESPFDWVISKDTLEHVPFHELGPTLRKIVCMARKGGLIIVPLSNENRTSYLTPADNADTTHQIKGTLPDWMDWLQCVINHSGSPLFISGGYRIPGIKQAADPYPKSCGFITLRNL